MTARDRNERMSSLVTLIFSHFRCPACGESRMPNLSRPSNTFNHLVDNSRPQRLHHQVDDVLAASALGRRAGKVLAEDRRQRRRVGEEEIAQTCDRNIEMYRVDTPAKGSSPH